MRDAMAVFKFPDDQRRLGWLILRDGPFVLFFDRSKLDEACAWFLRHSYQVVAFNCTNWQSDDDFHNDISASLKFPNYYGHNLDALSECMRFDLDIPQESGLLLVFYHFDVFKKRFPKISYVLLDTLTESSRQYLLYGQRLITFIQSDNQNIVFEPVGACHIMRAHWEAKHYD